jgi:phage-related minor tail protein
MTDSLDSLSLRTTELRAEMQDLSKLADSFGNKLVGAFSSAIIHGKSLSDVVKGLVLSLSQTALSAALKPLGNLVGNMFGSLFAHAKGNVISQGQVTPFAAGGIVNSPVLFPMRGGTGLMGEAGPEAIMPLTRGSDGALGVRASGGRTTHVTVNITTPDMQSFRQSQSQIAALMNRAVSRGARNL